MADLSPEVRFASRAAGESAYRQLLKRIAQAAPTEALPPSRILCRELNVSLGTLRRALHRLVEEGYLYALDRRGFFVSKVRAPVPYMRKTA